MLALALVLALVLALARVLAPEVREAMTKVEEFATLASSAKTEKDREYYERMRRKWLGLADGWRFIDEIGDRGDWRRIY